MHSWIPLFGKSQDDPALMAALRSAGVNKVPKLDDDDTDVRFDIKGQGLWLMMTDESYLKDLDDQDIGEGPLILSAVGAYLDKSESKDLYKGTLPYPVKAGMEQVAVRQILGEPDQSDITARYDEWAREGIELTASYTKVFKLAMFVVSLPGAE